jgi:TonB family protein
MLHPFVSSSTTRRNWTPVLALSALVHVGLIWAAVTSTGVVRPAHLTAEAAVGEQVQFATLPFRVARSVARRSNSRGARRRRANARPATFKLPELLLTFDLVLPEPPPLPDYRPDDLALEIGGSSGLTEDALHLGVGLATSSGTAGGPRGWYDEVAVEKRALPVAANAKPRYPSRMLSRGIESNFEVYFVVDTSGTVDKETVELPPSVQQEFTNAVEEVLYNWRFVPAELGGRRVRQRVLQPFTFRMEGPFRGR